MTKPDLAEIRASLRARIEQERRREQSRFGGVFARKPAAPKPPEPLSLDPPPRRIGPAAQSEAKDRALFGQRRAPTGPPPLVLDAPLALDWHAAAGVASTRATMPEPQPPPALPPGEACEPPPDRPEIDAKVAAALHLEGTEILARLERLLSVEQAGLELRLAARAAA